MLEKRAILLRAGTFPLGGYRLKDLRCNLNGMSKCWPYLFYILFSISGLHRLIRLRIFFNVECFSNL